jgi:glutaminyl-tRNA synthetase
MSTTTKPESDEKTDTGIPHNFIKDIIDEDLRTGKRTKVATRFPPEPNGYLHIGHAKSICLNFGLAKDYNGTCNLRFDDTNPTKENEEYVNSIKADVRWLGFDWGDREYYASDYFDQLYEWAKQLIKEGLAYVDDLSDEEIKEYRGNYYIKAKESPYRNRSVKENLDLFERMKNGEFKDGEKVLRAKGDLEASNMNLRDPLMYRIRHAHHHRTGDKWCIYPMYDWAHGESDAIEGITHSICTLEFQDHRPLYEWYTAALKLPNPPQQIEFARLNLNYTVMSKRKLLELVERKLVDGWDDPRMPTISGLRRRGYTPSSIRAFAERIGVAKADSGTVDMALLEYCIREDLNAHSPRLMGVLDPLKVVITNYPADTEEFFEAPLHPENPAYGSRKLPFCNELYIERDDFREDAPNKWHRLAPGKEVRLRYACLITCNEIIKDESGKIIELRCTWDEESRGGQSPDGRKVRGTLHWVSARHAFSAEVRLYDRLFLTPDPMVAPEGKDWLANMNPDSLTILKDCKLEPYLKSVKPGDQMQFERLGYFCVDSRYSKPDAPVFNRTVTLKDGWARVERNQEEKPAETQKPTESDVPALTASASALRPDLKPLLPEVKIDDFAKLDLRAGYVVEAKFVEGADKLLRVMVDLGEGRLRQIFSGIREFYPDPQKLVGKQVAVIANLKPRKMRFGLSEGMILAGGDDNGFSLVTFDGPLKPGDPIS